MCEKDHVKMWPAGEPSRRPALHRYRSPLRVAYLLRAANCEAPLPGWLVYLRRAGALASGCQDLGPLSCPGHRPPCAPQRPAHLLGPPLLPRAAAAPGAPDSAALLSRSRQGRSIPPAWPVSRAAPAWWTPCRAAAQGAAWGGTRWRARGQRGESRGTAPGADRGWRRSYPTWHPAAAARPLADAG